MGGGPRNESLSAGGGAAPIRAGVSVVIPYFAHNHVAERAARALVLQDHRPLEAVIVDDQSPLPFPPTLLADLEQGGVLVKHIVKETNTGVADARNVGVDAAAFEYLVFLDHDDWLTPFAVTKCLDDCRPGTFVLYDNHLVEVDADDRIEMRNETLFSRAGWVKPTVSLQDQRLLLNGFPISKIMVHREDFRRAGGYAKKIDGIEDFFLIWCLLATGSIGLFNDEPLGYYRISEFSATALVQKSRRRYIKAQVSWIRIWSRIFVSRSSSPITKWITAKHIAHSIAAIGKQSACTIVGRQSPAPQ